MPKKPKKTLEERVKELEKCFMDGWIQKIVPDPPTRDEFRELNRFTERLKQRVDEVEQSTLGHSIDLGQRVRELECRPGDLDQRVTELQKRVREALRHEVPSIQEFVIVRSDLHYLRNRFCELKEAVAEIPKEPRAQRWADGSWRISTSQAADLARRLGYLEQRLDDVEADIYKYNPTTEVAKRIKQRVADRDRLRDAEEVAETTAAMGPKTVSEPHRGPAEGAKTASEHVMAEPKSPEAVVLPGHIGGNARTYIAPRLPTAEELARKWHELECGDMVPYAESAPGYRQELLRTTERLLAWLRER